MKMNVATFFHSYYSLRLLILFVWYFLGVFFSASALFTVSSMWVTLNLLCKASVILTLPSWNTKTQQYSWSAGPLELFITNDSVQFKEEERTDIHAILSQIKCCLPYHSVSVMQAPWPIFMITQEKKSVEEKTTKREGCALELFSQILLL